MQRMEIGQKGVTNVAITSKKKQALPCDQREVSQWSFLLLVGGNKWSHYRSGAEGGAVRKHL